jgi:transcription elongation factor GreB
LSQSRNDSQEDDEDQPFIPKGAKNYITPAGWRRLHDELRRLLREERPRVTEIVSWAAGNGDRSENGDYIYGKKRLREIDRRIRFLNKRLEIAEIVDPAAQPNKHKAFFGATVTYAREDGTENTVTIMGVDEANPELKQISWVSPVARALLKAEVGDLVRLRMPAGEEELEVLAISYPPGE